MTSDIGLPPLLHPWIETADAPLFVLRYPVQHTDAEMRDVHECIHAFYRKLRQPVAWVADTSAVVFARATERAIIAQHKEQVRSYEIALNAGTAIVITSGILRGALTAITWASPFKHPYEICADVESGKEWARARLLAAQRQR